MAKIAVSILPSLLDRLIDENPQAAQDTPRSRAAQLQALRDSVRRDLEALLNTHRRCISPPPFCDELAVSVIEFGAPDFVSTFAAAHEAREDFRLELERIIKLYEPRFQSVAVKLIDDEDQLDRTLRFRIDALMYAEPAPESVVFNSRLDPASHSFSVTGGGDG